MNKQFGLKIINLVTAGLLTVGTVSPALAAETTVRPSGGEGSHVRAAAPLADATGAGSLRGGPNGGSSGSRPGGGDKGGGRGDGPGGTRAGSPGGSNRGPGQSGGVGLGGPGGGGPGGPGKPGQPGGAGNLATAGFGGRGGGGGLSGVGPGGQPGPQPGPGSNSGRPSLSGIGIGGGIGRNNPGPAGVGPLGQSRPGGSGQTGAGGIGGPNGIGVGRPDRGNGIGIGPGGAGAEVGPLLGQLNPPSVLDNLEAGAQAQQAIETAAEQGNEAMDQAIESAQQAYETLWDDYYAAVDYAADAYYQAVTGAITYGADAVADTYSAAVEQSLAVVDDYYAVYDAYLDYIAMYPWDSYAYVYDEAAQSYVTQEPVNVYYYNYYYDAAATAESTAPVTTTTTIPQPAALPTAQLPAPSAEAYEALVIFANDQLGAVVEPLYAGAATQEVLNVLAVLPAVVQNPAYTATNLDAAGYYGLFKGGAAALAVGECPAGEICAAGADLPAELSQAALGVYAFQTGEAMPATPSEALQLATLVYPKLTGLQFTQLADVQGYAFTAQTSSVAVRDGQPEVVAKVVLTGVININGRTVVYAAVGLGESYANLLNPVAR